MVERGGGISTFKGRRKKKGGEGGGGINGRRRDGESAILKEVNAETQKLNNTHSVQHIGSKSIVAKTER